MGLSFDQRAHRRINDRLTQSITFFDAPRPLLKAFALETIAWIDKNFKASGDPSWTPLTPSTIRGRRKGTSPFGIKILMDTGRMRASFDLDNLTNHSVDVVANDVKAIWHHRGTAHLPARPLLPTPKQILPRLLTIVDRVLDEEMPGRIA